MLTTKGLDFGGGLLVCHQSSWDQLASLPIMVAILSRSRREDLAKGFARVAPHVDQVHSPFSNLNESLAIGTTNAIAHGILQDELVLATLDQVRDTGQVLVWFVKGFGRVVDDRLERRRVDNAPAKLLGILVILDANRNGDGSTCGCRPGNRGSGSKGWCFGWCSGR